MNKCPFCILNVRTIVGLYWHFIFKHYLTGKLDEEDKQEPLPPLPAQDAD